MEEETLFTNNYRLCTKNITNNYQGIIINSQEQNSGLRNKLNQVTFLSSQVDAKNKMVMF